MIVVIGEREWVSERERELHLERGRERSRERLRERDWEREMERESREGEKRAQKRFANSFLKQPITDISNAFCRQGLAYRWMLYEGGAWYPVTAYRV